MKRIGLLVIALCILISACGNPTTTPSSAYAVSPSVLSVKVGGTVDFTTYPKTDSSTWVSTVGGTSAVPVYVTAERTDAGLRITAVKATPTGKSLIVSAVMDGHLVASNPVSITP